jgi:hypothetical protein
MNLQSLSKRQWVLISVSVVIVGVAVWAMQAGYLPEIGKFFAAEPGYVPSCAWYGEPVTPVQECCSGFVPAPVSGVKPSPTYILNDAGTVAGPESGIAAATPTPTYSPTKTPTPLPPYTLTPTPIPPQYCVLPGCQVVQRQVYCIQAPCPAQIQIICPSGITPPPPRPSVTPLGTIQVTNPFAGGTVAYGTQLPIRWDARGAAAESKTVVIELVKNDAPGGLFDIEPMAQNTGEYIWDTTRVLTGAFGQTIDLKQTPGDAYQIKVGIPGATPEQYMYDLSGTFSIKTGIPTPSPTSTSTVTPTPPVFKGISVGFNGGTIMTADIPITEPSYGLGLMFLPYPNNPIIGGAAVTAVQMTVAYNPKYLEPLQPWSALFKDVLQPVTIKTISPNSAEFSFTLGSGTAPAYIDFKKGDMSLMFKPLLIGDAGLVGIKSVIITTPGSSKNWYVADTSNISLMHVNVVSVSVPGDANGDGKVDIFDYNLVVSNFGRTGADIPGDVNKDGKVDIFDYNLVITNFGK